MNELNEFVTNLKSRKTVPVVTPKTYEESLLSLKAMRSLSKHLDTGDSERTFTVPESVKSFIENKSPNSRRWCPGGLRTLPTRNPLLTRNPKAVTTTSKCVHYDSSVQSGGDSKTPEDGSECQVIDCHLPPTYKRIKVVMMKKTKVK